MTTQTPPCPDDALMQQVADGDTDSFARLIRTHQSRVVGYASRLLGNDPDAAQDIAQEVFLSVWRGRGQYRAQGRFVVYLLQITRRATLDRLRRRPVATNNWDAWADAPAPDLTPEAALAAATFDAAVQEALARLPAGQHDVFVLSHYEQLSYREIAELLNCPIGTVASRKNGAVHALREMLRPWLPGNEEF